MSHTIIIGYGNVDRGDDGAAYAIINLLRSRWGMAPLEYLDTGMDALGAGIDSIFLSQLVPEVMELLLNYQKIIFVDAHTGEDMADLHCVRLAPEYSHSSFTHHMTPSALLAFLQTLYRHEPEAYLVSMRGYDFDFKQNLSPGTQALLPSAVDQILQLLETNSSNPVVKRP